MGKRVLSVAMALVLCVGLLPGTAWAADVVANGTCGADGDNLTWTLDSNGALTISGKGAMKSYSDVRYQPWASLRDQISNVIINDGVTCVGIRAFCACENLTHFIVPESLTTIREWGFSGCSSLSDIDLPSSVSAIEKGAFYMCKGSTDFVIPEGVMYIGSLAFAGWENLNSITIPSTVTDIGKQAFDYSSSLACINVDSGNKYYSSKEGVLFLFDSMLVQYPLGRTGAYTIPDGTTEICPTAFFNNRRLTRITIPGSVTDIGLDAFNQCDSLAEVIFLEGTTQTKTHIGVRSFQSCTGLKKIALPSSVNIIDDSAFSNCYKLTDVYYSGTEEQWNAISFVGKYNYYLRGATIHYDSSGIPQNASSVTAEQYCINVVNDNNQPISGATAIWGDSSNTVGGTTDKDGNVYFDDYTFGNPLITISQTGYTTWTNANSNWKKSANRYETIVLYPESYGAYKLREAWYANNSLMTGSSNILVNTKKLNLKNDGNLIGDLTSGKFYIACSAASNGGIVRYELWQTDKKIAESSSGFFDSLSVKSFSKGGGCFIRVVTSDGKQVDTNINLEFAENEIHKASSFTLKGKKATVKVDDDVPYLGGSTLNFDLPINVPVIYEESEDTFKVGLNMKLTNNKSTAEQMEDFHKLLERTSTYGTKGWTKKNKDNFKGHLQQYNEADFFKKCDVTFAAYFEGDCASAQGTGYLAILIDLDVLDLEYNTIIVVVPASVQIGIDFTLEVGAKASYSFSDGTLSGNVMLNPSVKLEAFGGVALSKFGGVGAYGSAALLIIYNLFGTEEGLRSIDLTGELGLKAYLGPLTYQRPFAHQTWHLYTANNVQARASMLMAAPWNDGLYDAAQYYIDDLSYLAEESGWLGEAGSRRALLMAAPASAKTEFKNLLTDTYRNAQPVMVSSGDALYAAFVRADAETGARYVVVTKSTDGATWLEPVRVDTSAILDDAPTMCVSNDGTVWLAYARTTAAPGDSLLTYARNQEIVVGSIDPDTLAFTKSAAYTGSGFTHMQQLAVLNNQPVLMWADTLLTDENSVLLPASGAICYAEYSNGAWSDATELANVTGAISSVTPGLSDNTIIAAYVSDGVLYTTDHSSAVAENVTGRVTYGVLPGMSEAAFLWNGDGVLNSSIGAEITAEGITHEYAIVGDRVYYSMATDNSANLAVLQYADGNWSLPIQLTGDSRYLENLSVARLDGSDYVLGMHTAVTISEDSVEDAKNIVCSRVMPVSDLRIDGIDYDDSELTAGEDIAVTLTVTNAGDHTVSSVELSLDGSTVKTESVDLLPGQSAEITTSIACPSTLTSYAFEVNEPDESDYTPSDNSYEISIGYADAVVEIAYQQIGTGKALVATVTNQGIDDASGSVIFYDADGDPVAESTFENLASGDIAIASYTVTDSFAGVNGGDVSAKVVLNQDERYTYNNEATMHILAPYLPTSIKGIDVIAGGVLATVYCEDGVEATAYCATYNAAGQMLKVASQELNAGEEASIEFAVGSAAITKVFVLDDAQIPLCNSESVLYNE